MNEKLMKYLDGVFSQYEDETPIRELKEELKVNLQERWSDLKAQGHDDETAYKMTIDSIGDISEAVKTVAGTTKELKEMVNKNLSLMQLEGSDLQGIRIHDGKFNYSALKGTDFSNSDLTNSSFLCSDLTSVTFDGANLTGAKLTMCALNGASFERCVLTQTHFHTSDLSGVRLENLTLEERSLKKQGWMKHPLRILCCGTFPSKIPRCEKLSLMALPWTRSRMPF